MSGVERTTVTMVEATPPEKPAATVVVTEATAQRSTPKPPPVKTITYPVGTTVDLDVDPEATAVIVERPDGSEVTVVAGGGRAVYVLDQAGIHIAGGLAIHATILGIKVREQS